MAANGQGLGWMVLALSPVLVLACDGSADPGALGDDAGGRADGGAGADGSPRDDAGGRDAARPDGAIDAGADASTPPPPERWFDDVTVAAGVMFERTATDGYDTLPDRMSGGVCVIDVDGERPYDLFFAARHESRLYVASAPLAYTDETEARGLADTGDAMGCLAFDADGDGDQDLLVTGIGDLRLFHNDGGTFSPTDRIVASPHPADMLMGASAGDIDGDGDLDLLVSGFVRFDPARHAEGAPCGLALCSATLTAYEYAPDLLLEQMPDGRFHDVAEARAPDLRAPEPGLVSVIRDLDGDGSPDLYVGNDLGYTYWDRVLVRDASGSYRDVAEELGLAYDWRGYGIDTMGFASGDLDGDGHADHVTTSFETDATAVFVWQPAGHYEDLAVPLGTIALRDTFRWGVALVDLDLDGDVDLFEATGHFHSDAEVEAFGYLSGREQRPNLMVNLGDGTLRAVTPATGDGMDALRASRGLAVTDLDDDGRPDLVLAPAVGAPALLRNVRPPTGHWLGVLLRGAGANREAIGARVTVRAGGRSWFRDRILGEGYLGSSDPRLFIGLPDPGSVDIEVRWPSGARTTVHGVALDAEIAISEG